MRVANMVCPDCARMNGQEHRAGCPHDPDPGLLPDELAAYTDGWRSARDALLPPLCDELVKWRDLATKLARPVRDASRPAHTADCTKREAA